MKVMFLVVIGSILVLVGTAAALLWDKVQKHHRVHRYLVLLLGCALPVLGTYLTILAGQQESIKLSRDVSTAMNELRETKTELQGTKKAVIDLIGQLANKPELDPTMRSEILQTKVKYEVGLVKAPDLSTLVSSWSNKLLQVQIKREQERLKAAQGQKDNIQSFLNVCQYAITTFQSTLSNSTRSNGIVVLSDFEGLPTVDDLCHAFVVSPASSGEVAVPICEISVQTNFAWNCQCSVTIPNYWGTDSTFLHVYFRCVSKKGSSALRLSVDGSALETELCGRSVPCINERYVLADYKKVVDEALRNFIGAQADDFAPVTVGTPTN